MNLNYSSINPDQFSEEIKEKYAFPADKSLIEKFKRNEISGITRQEKKAIREQSHQMAFAILASLTLGTISYIYLGFPDGVLLRQKMDAKFSPLRRISRRVIPFIGLALPVYLVRTSEIFTNN